MDSDVYTADLTRWFSHTVAHTILFVVDKRTTGPGKVSKSVSQEESSEEHQHGQSSFPNSSHHTLRYRTVPLDDNNLNLHNIHGE